MILSEPLVFSHKIKRCVGLQSVSLAQNAGNGLIENLLQKQIDCNVLVCVERINILL